jgi:hypothetical protein
LAVLLSAFVASARAADPPKPPAAPTPNVALRVLVVNEVGLAEAIERLRGEWAERSGATLSATTSPWSDLAEAKTVDADLVIFPTRYLGEFCTRGWLRPVRKNVLESNELNADDYYPLVRQQLITWGGQVMALPLGIDFPIGSQSFNRWPGAALLARVETGVIGADREAELFDPKTMKPRIAELPFVAALNELSADHDRGGAKALSRVPVLGVGDRMAAVTSASRNAAGAFKLLAWLASSDISSQFARAGNGTMPVRVSMASSSSWYDQKMTASERNDLGKLLQQTLGGRQCLVVLRIPGVDEYLEALDDAVKSVAFDRVDPQTALVRQSGKRSQTLMAATRSGKPI